VIDALALLYKYRDRKISDVSSDVNDSVQLHRAEVPASAASPLPPVDTFVNDLLQTLL
jgi:hypothetical protein